MRTKFLVGCFFLLVTKFWSPGDERITDVKLGASVFNPAVNTHVQLAYNLATDAAVTVRVYDSDSELVATLTRQEQRKGPQTQSWDGKDFSGKPVPDGAYTFTIETASGAVYDPTTFSGGVIGDITEARFDREAGTMVYSLPAAARVLIRLGIKSGPMYKTLVDWEPRVAGSITEQWDGLDENKITSLHGHKDFNALISYVTLPEATVITYGNAAETYRDYKLGRGKDRPKKPVRPRVPDPKVVLAPEGLVPPASARAPRVSLSFPKEAEPATGVPVARDGIDVRVDVDPADKEALLNQQFEIIFYVDNVFFAEAERGHLPYNWPWELQQLPPGEHLLTVNISSFKGQVGVATRKVNVQKGK